ncbi:MAG: collagen binding domain-containing protein, partial [Sedimentibacter sp.]
NPDIKPCDLLFVQANVFNKNYCFGPVESMASITVKNPIIAKESDYTPGTDYVKWTVPINSNSITLNNVVISDELQDELSLDVDSVKLYHMTVAPDGTQTRGDKVSPEEYTVEYSTDTNISTFIFKKAESFYEINSPYELEFITDVLVNQVSINNELALHYKNLIYYRKAIDKYN